MPTIEEKDRFSIRKGLSVATWLLLCIFSGIVVLYYQRNAVGRRRASNLANQVIARTQVLATTEADAYGPEREELLPAFANQKADLIEAFDRLQRSVPDPDELITVRVLLGRYLD